MAATVLSRSVLRRPCLPALRFFSTTDGPEAPSPSPAQAPPTGYFSRLGRMATENVQIRSGGDWLEDDDDDDDLDTPPLELAKRPMGSLYEPEELNWVDQASESKPKFDFRANNPGPDIMCRGKRQRHGFKKPTCDLIDLDDLHFTNLPLMERYLNESGTIKPRKQTGLCTKCQRKLSKTVKQSRQMAMIPYIQDFSTMDNTVNLSDLTKGGRYDRQLVIERSVKKM